MKPGLLNLDAEKVLVANAMINYGGGFVQCLGKALARADFMNTALIKQTWPNYWQQYLELGEKDEARANTEQQKQQETGE